MLLLTIAAVLGAPSSLYAQEQPNEPDVGFRLVDDFETLNAGEIDGRNGWLATENAVVISDPVDAGNSVLRLEQGSTIADKVLTATIAEEASGTLFFRLRRQGTQGVWAGVGDVAPPTEWTDLAVQTGYSVFTPGPFHVRDGNSVVVTAQTFAENTWYCVWLALDNEADAYQVYVQGGEWDEPSKLSRFGDQTFDFYRNEESLLETFSFRTGDNAEKTGSLWLDDVYVDPDSIKITNPGDNPCSPPPPDPCNELALGHSGDGEDPTAAPRRSTGCTLGSYVADEAITLTAEPASGWRVAGWSGTDDNSSISTSNRLTMPDRTAEASVTYVPAPSCYALTLSHTGNGSDPVAQPDRSAGCPLGEYTPGQNIALTASPAAGWAIVRWSGTNDDGSTSPNNSMTMPERNASASVTYAPVCFALTLSHTGEGADPVATPAQSGSCAPGRYFVGEAIALQAAPAPGWRVADWSGTNNDASSSDQNALIMPAADAVVSVRYERSCFPLTRSHAGDGDDPVATPDRSDGCPLGQYLADESISLSANPAPGWTVARWSGTDNDTSTANGNTLTMPGEAATVVVVYAEGDDLSYSLTVTVEGNGFVRKEPDQPTYEPDTAVRLTAVADPGWIFSRWEGDIAGPQNPVTVTVNKNLVVTAVFVESATCYPLTRSHSGRGADPVATPTASTGCEEGEYVVGEALILTASPADNWLLVGWLGTENDASTSLQNSLIMPAAPQEVFALYLPDSAGATGRAYLPIIDLAAPPPPFPALTNGNFDAPNDVSWSESSSQGLQLIVTEQYVADTIGQPFAAQSVPKLAWLGGIREEQAEIAQPVELPEGIGNVRLSFYHWIASRESICGDDRGRVLVGESELRTFDLCRSSNTGRWERIELSLDTHIGETINLRFLSTQDGDELSNWYIDSVRLCNGSGAQPCE